MTPEEHAARMEKEYREAPITILEFAQTDAERKDLAAAKKMADRYGLWNEVCWSALQYIPSVNENLKAALDCAMYDWDL